MPDPPDTEMGDILSLIRPTEKRIHMDKVVPGFCPLITAFCMKALQYTIRVCSKYAYFKE